MRVPRPTPNDVITRPPFRIGAGALFIALAIIAGVAQRKLERQHRQALIAQDYELPPAGMVFVPAGEFIMGSDEDRAEPDEQPSRKVFLPAFYIDRFEVTNRRYREFNPAHSYPPGADELPATGVLKREAEDYCRLAGKRLPTSAEWEKAARGPDGRIFPWGNEFIPGYANVKNPGSQPQLKLGAKCDLPSGSTNASGLRSVGSFPRGVSPYGCEDMSGNAWEWVSDVHWDKNLLGLNDSTSARGILRGGGFGYSAFQLRASYQGFEDLNTTCHDTGFRCAMTAVPKNKPDR